MALKLISKHLNGLILLEPIIFVDFRGFFMETYREDQFQEWGIPTHFAQDNHSSSKKGVIRGMHFQWEPIQGKLIRVTSGKSFVAEIDIRHDSPTLGKWIGFELSAENKRILWVPHGFANGFCVLSDYVEMQYKCTSLWNPKGESAILWNDPKVGIEWPITESILSEKDRNAQTLENWLMREESKKLKFNSIT